MKFLFAKHRKIKDEILAMTADLLKLCDPTAYYNQFLSESIYPDGRSIGSFRPILLRVSF